MHASVDHGDQRRSRTSNRFQADDAKDAEPGRGPWSSTAAAAFLGPRTDGSADSAGRAENPTHIPIMVSVRSASGCTDRPPLTRPFELCGPLAATRLLRRPNAIAPAATASTNYDLTVAKVAVPM